ncbi:sugar phosphate isomerase/epimerase family protein [Propionivibrio dicarboxylicus]|uniref:Sugar phosphate isomerase/epimerase n=1 Tax=Propionivibrio dicarboxylicus TaxID=83767 RepID=A0A1G7Z6C4_9RHOO|nr:TIM barrel protein [Propionivibrio dicarboxylicus]SDH03680.1 Sugar phosphate isomerase/epimerase [Propionivibrio dicarboxylicus]
MDESIRKYMRVGLIHFMAYPSVIKGEGPVEETFRKIALDDYFEAVEITSIKDPAVRQRVKKMIDTSHIDVAYGGQPRLLTTGMNINDLDEVARKRAIANLKEGIDEAYEMGAQGFAFLSGKYTDDKLEDAYRALVASTLELCAYAKSKGDLKIALEVFDFDVDKKSLIGPVALAKRYAEEIRAEYDNFGLMVDLSHIPLLHETVAESLLPIKDYIIHAHMGNCVVKDSSWPAYGDAHPRFGFPGGENDVDELVEYLQILKQIGFLNKDKRPIVSFEVKPVGDEDPDLVVANAKRVLNLAWEQVV